MRKSISLLLILFVAFVSLKTHAKSLESNLVGTWVGDVIVVSEDNLSGYITPVVAFNENKNGSYSFLINTTYTIDTNTSIEILIAGNIPGKWMLDEDDNIVLSLNKERFVMNITDKCFKINSKDNEVAQLLEEYKPILINDLSKIKDTVLESIPEKRTFSNPTIKKSKLYLTTEDGSTMTFTRGRSKKASIPNNKREWQ